MRKPVQAERTAVAHVAVSPKRPETIHYRGQGEFMVAGHTITLRKEFKPDRL